MTIANHEQSAHWNNGEEVGHWVDQQTRYDSMLAPFLEMVLEACPADRERVLDVGCGCGATTMAAARRVPAGHATGIDLSGPMLARARSLAAAEGLANVRFEQTDAQVHPFEAGTVDAVISRFGVMFFADPVVAFENLRRATKPGGRLAFVCWQPLSENQWVLVPTAALAEHVPVPPPGPPGATGMFAFADPSRPTQILEAAGWRTVDATSRRTHILLGGPGTVGDAVDFLAGGSLGRTLLGPAGPEVRAAALDAARDALEPFFDDDGVRIGAAVWLVTAEA